MNGRPTQADGNDTERSGTAAGKPAVGSPAEEARESQAETVNDAALPPPDAAKLPGSSDGGAHRDAPPPISLTGPETVEALKSWEKEGFKLAASQPYDLGKTFLGFSLTTTSLAATLVTLFKERLQSSAFAVVSIGILFFIVGAVVALRLVLPKNKDTHGRDDIKRRYKDHIRKVTGHAWAWMITWLLGVAIVAAALLLMRK